jgi:hypothetical protein
MDVLSRPSVPIKGLIKGFLGQLKFPRAVSMIWTTILASYE